MVSSIQNSINSVLFSATDAGSGISSTSATSSLLSSAFSTEIPDLQVTQADGNTLSLETLVAAELATNDGYNVMTSVYGGSSASDLLASSYGASSSLDSVLSSSYNTSGTSLDLVV